MANYQRYRLNAGRNAGAIVWATSLEEARNRWQDQDPQPANGPVAAPFLWVQGPAPVQPPRPIQWHVQSAIPSSMGDETGTSGGVASGMNFRPALQGLQQAQVAFAPIQGAPPPVWQAGANQPRGAGIAPSQVKLPIER
ncbi:hypothetical protein BurJ1DRAFT_3261 [Burkholderiales bacterium JOSHI_001]|nr:hypothetical protein BurJ1DRAFT_3261 [Burkholderiales bacterium JOSHI_001]